MYSLTLDRTVVYDNWDDKEFLVAYFNLCRIVIARGGTVIYVQKYTNGKPDIVDVFQNLNIFDEWAMNIIKK